MVNKSHSRNTSLQSIIKEGELPDEPIGIGADRVYVSNTYYNHKPLLINSTGKWRP